MIRVILLPLILTKCIDIRQSVFSSLFLKVFILTVYILISIAFDCQYRVPHFWGHSCRVLWPLGSVGIDFDNPRVSVQSSVITGVATTDKRDPGVGGIDFHYFVVVAGSYLLRVTSIEFYEPGGDQRPLEWPRCTGGSISPPLSRYLPLQACIVLTPFAMFYTRYSLHFQ